MSLHQETEFVIEASQLHLMYQLTKNQFSYYNEQNVTLLHLVNYNKDVPHLKVPNYAKGTF